MIPSSLQELKRQFAKYPGVGPRQAERYAFFVLKQPEQDREALIAALTSLQNIQLCKQCFLPTEKNETGLCAICADPKRNNNLICVVEKESDALNMEKAKAHEGTYHILGENISPLTQSEVAKKRLKALVARVQNAVGDETKEIILALNNTREGNFTTLYAQELFKQNELPNTRITRLGRGLATGSELEYADEDTLRNALLGRQ